MQEDAWTYHDARRERGANVHIRDARVDVHADRLAVLDEYLLEQHALDFAGFYERIWHEVAFWPVRTIPTETQSFLFRSARLN